ncbi:hypothetical protein BGZ61DRAFT_465651 [Ilyonectria robusta]|uniref:uncharacterized protein n=1 Tax=Ilyonectria robusta TaxID=1079257 RepID=UPI001E8D66D4|nr:uncharacterized protein BGZ61DRAFT_465651 [Ilyonectria robusta]KAH8658891.1 hypothetical protein BGZ61DRAFT_465651 [Ilyonectria robusta]
MSRRMSSWRGLGSPVISTPSPATMSSSCGHRDRVPRGIPFCVASSSRQIATLSTSTMRPPPRFSSMDSKTSIFQ